MSHLYTYELFRRIQRKQAVWLSTLFPEQRGFVADDSKLVAALCSRRSGKSVGCAFRLKRAADRHPGEMSLYISKTKNNSRMIVGRALQDMSRKWDWGLTMKEVDGRLMAVWPNGHMTWLAGAEHRPDFEIFRGFHFAEVIVDEAQLYPWLREVIDDVLEATVADLDGAMVLTGTPSAVPTGFFHAVTTGEDTDDHGSRIPQWPTHSWTMAENTFFRAGEGAAYREALRIRRGWAEDHPTFVREYFGRWVRDDGALIFPYSRDLNGWDGPLPDGDWTHIVGCDLGTNQSEPTTAFVVLGYRRRFPEVYVLESEKRAGLIPASIAARLEGYRQKYRPAAIVVDQGGLGGGYIREFAEVYGLPVEGVTKADKPGRIELVRGDLRSGLIKVLPSANRDLIGEMAVMQWNEDGSGFDDRFADHLLDAWVYAHGKVRAYYRPEVMPPAPGSPEAINAEARAEKARREREVMRKQRERMRKGKL